MSKNASREIQLDSRPTGSSTGANFAMAGIELAPLQDQQVLVRSLYVSVDPYRFVADGRWPGDPGGCQRVANPYGGFNSILKLPLEVRTSIL
jgi:hypothetical protein